MVDDFLVFDLETQRDFQSVGGRLNIHLLKMSVGVVWDQAKKDFLVFEEAGVEDLKKLLSSGRTVVGFNQVYFDYTVLSGYGKDRETEYTKLVANPHLDLMLDLQASLGHRLSLNSLVEPTLRATKSADGLMALEWFDKFAATGDRSFMDQIIHYCKQDVAVTRDLYLYGLKHQKVFYISKNSALKSVGVNWQKFSAGAPKKKAPMAQQTLLF